MKSGFGLCARCSLLCDREMAGLAFVGPWTRVGARDDYVPALSHRWHKTGLSSAHGQTVEILLRVTKALLCFRFAALRNVAGANFIVRVRLS